MKNRTRPINPLKIDRFLNRIIDRGFTVHDCMTWLTGGWIRLYDYRAAEHLRDFTGKVEPRCYSAGAVGVQISWGLHSRGEDVEEKATITTWRN